MSVRGSEQAVVTDFDEAFGQDVLKEAADKLLGGNGRESGPISGRILVGKSHLAILEGEDPAIADGDAKDVRSEVFEGGGACAYRLRVNDPIFAPDLLIKEMEETVVSRPGQFNIGLLAQPAHSVIANDTLYLMETGNDEEKSGNGIEYVSEYVSKAKRAPRRCP